MSARAESPPSPAGRDGSASEEDASWPRRLWRGLAGAVAFLTIIPVASTERGALSAAAAWFPVVGALIGALAGGVRLGCGSLVGASVASLLALISLVIVTGALHVDGLADTADGLGARGGRAQRLEAMGDSQTGAFGALALIFWSALMVATVASLSGDHALRALIAACALARWAALAHGAGTPPARSEGLGAALRVRPLTLALTTVLVAGIALASCGLVAGAAALGAGAALAALSIAFARNIIGGRTGDTLGATVAVTEALVCVVLLAVWGG